MHTTPGGQCASWTRKGYTFAACIHHLMGCREGTKFHDLWREMGAMPCELVPTQESVAVVDATGQMFHDYYDLDRLTAHMTEIAPEDREEIINYARQIKKYMYSDVMGRMLVSSMSEKLKLAFHVPFKYFGVPMKEYAQRFKNPLLRHAIPLLEYSIEDIPAAVHFIKRGAGSDGDIK